jgi:hypothetical protein
VEVWEEWKDKGFVILALSDESKSEIERFIPEFKPTYPIGTGSRTKDKYGVSGIPRASLIDHEGTVIWDGHPGDETWVGMIPAALQTAAEVGAAWDPGERPAALAKAVAAAKAGTIGRAWKESEAVRAKSAADAEALGAVEAFQKDLLARAQTRTLKQEAFVASGRYWEGTLYFEREIKVFDGAPPAEEWKALLAGWKKDPAVKPNLELDKKRLAALQKAREGDKEKALKELRALLEKAEGLPVKQAIQETYQKVGSA